MAGIFTPTRLYVSAAFGTVAMTTFGLDRAAAVWRFGARRFQRLVSAVADEIERRQSEGKSDV